MPTSKFSPLFHCTCLRLLGLREKKRFGAIVILPGVVGFVVLDDVDVSAIKKSKIDLRS